MTRPGLSSFASNAQKAAESLDDLLKEAERVVPRTMWKCTPVAVKATAGLRLLGAVESDAILAAVKQRLQSKYEFPVISKDGVVIMDGKDEGVYAWITANYLLNTLPSGPATTNANVDSSSSVPYAVLDLGGASTQIVFRPSFDADGDGVDDPGMGLEDGEHKYDLHFGGRDHVLYQHSYLGYGLMRARAGVHRVVEFMGSYSSTTSPKKRPGRPEGGLKKGAHIGAGGVGESADDEDDDDDDSIDFEDEVANPCISRGMHKTVEVDIGRDGTKVLRNVTMNGADIASWNACNRVLELVMAKDA